VALREGVGLAVKLGGKAAVAVLDGVMDGVRVGVSVGLALGVAVRVGLAL
jgi:hypothetical protein